MQEKYSPIITQSHSHGFLNICSSHLFFFWDISLFFVFFTLLSSIFCSGHLNSVICSERLALQDSVQTFIAYPYSKHFYIFIYVLSLYLYRTRLQVRAVMSHAHTFCLIDKIRRETQPLLFCLFFFKECTTPSTCLPFFSHWTCYISSYLQTDLKIQNLLKSDFHFL